MFIATLAPAEHVSGDNSHHNVGEVGGDSSVWIEGIPADEAVVSPDGTQLAFVSRRSLTGYDNAPVESRDCTTQEEFGEEGVKQGSLSSCDEVYLYDARTGSLTCPSCDRSGARPAGNADLGPPLAEGVNGNNTGPAGFYRRRNFSVDGGRLFFETKDALTPRDSNGREDVYELERDGEGSCGMPERCVFAISNVSGSSASFFLDASANGNDVFFGTADQLLPQDRDDLDDVYDARVEGGFPVVSSLAPCDNGDSCKPPPAPQPGVFGAPATATFSGAGNPVYGVTPAPPAVRAVVCGKGRSRKGTRCVKARKGHKRRGQSAKRSTTKGRR
jgi:hypothetical protein